MNAISKILPDYPDLLGIPHLVEITGQSAQTMRGLCARGELPAVRIGRRWYVPKASFVEFLGAAYDAA